MNKLKTFLSVIFSIVVFFLCIVLTISVVSKNYLSKNSISSILKENDMSFFLSDLNSEEQEVFGKTKEIFKEIGVPEDAVEQVLNSEGTKNFVSIYVSNTIDYFFDPTEETKITKDDLNNLIKDNLAIIETNLSKEEKELLGNYEETLYNYIDEHEEEVLKYFPTPKQVLDYVNQDDIVISGNITLNDLINYIRFFISNTFIYSLVGIIVVFLFIIFLLKRKEFKWSKYYANIFLIYTFLMVIIEILLSTIVKNALINKIEIANNILNDLVNRLCISLWVGVLISFIIGLASLILYKNKKKKESIA